MEKGDISKFPEYMVAIGHFMKLAHQIHPGYMPLAMATALSGAAFPFLNIIMSRYLLNELVGEKSIDRLILYAGILVIGNALLEIVSSILDRNLQIAGEKLADGFELHVGVHIMHMDFEKLEDAKVLDMKEKALFNIKLHDALLGDPRTIVDIFRLFFILAGVTGMIAVLSPILIAVMFLLIGINAFIYSRIQTTKFKFYKDIAVYNRQFAYFQNLTQNFENAKDVRIYNMAGYIIGRINHFHNCAGQIFNRMFLKQRRHDGFTAVDIQTQTLAAYGFAVWSVLQREIMIGDFTMYISAANQFSSVATQLMAKLVDLQMLGRVLQDYLAFEQLPCQSSNGSRKIASVDSATIEYRNVWFKYPNAGDYSLKNISLTIQSGKKLSIVGQNGAGKTTLIKLLCRLYRPDKGCILLNGTDINEFEEAEYSRVLSVIFQDYKIFSFSVKENLAFFQKADEGRLRASLEKAGILKRVEELPSGADTPLNKNFDKDGIEFSGGEMQKIAIARVLYKNAPLVVLDEPTASLDPYSEYEVYAGFHQLSEGKTTIYISHRLSSCRFCDAIAVLDNGELVEYGNHEQLVRAESLYAKMWNAQAQYYQ